jgi:hypothetical protein
MTSQHCTSNHITQLHSTPLDKTALKNIMKRYLTTATIILACAAIGIGVFIWYIEAVTTIFMSFP